MAWLEIHQTLPDHRKTLAVADLLHIAPVHAMGHLITFWLWALDNAPTGDLRGITPGIISRVAQWDGEPDDFVGALLEAGFFDVSEDGLKIHDWGDYAGRLIDRRDSERERSRQRRAAEKRDKQTTNRQRSNDQLTTAGQPSDNHQTTDGTVQYSTEQYNTVPKEGDSSSTDVDERPPTNPPDEEPDVKEKPRSPFKSFRQQRFFDAFWREYPRQQGKGQAARAWLKIMPDEDLFADIMAGLSRAKDSQEWVDQQGRYIPNPSTWLNGTRWEDTYTPKTIPKLRLIGNTQRALEAVRRFEEMEVGQ